MPLGPNDLILPHMAMVDVEPPMTFVSKSFEDRCVAAAAGGFAGIGIAHTLYYDEKAEGRTDADFRAMMRDHGVVLAEVESIGMTGPAERAAFEADVHAILTMVDALGGEEFFVVPRDNVSVDEHVETFGWVCDQCEGRGLRVGIEFMNIPGVSGVRDLRTARDVAERAGRPNGGVLVDTYHFSNGPNDWADLEALPGDLVKAIQFSDGAVPPAAPTYIEDTLHHRAPPGEGDFDLVRFVRTMDQIGASCAYSVEVLDADMRLLTVEELGKRLGDATRAVLAAARNES